MLRWGPAAEPAAAGCSQAAASSSCRRHWRPTHSVRNMLRNLLLTANCPSPPESPPSHLFPSPRPHQLLEDVARLILGHAAALRVDVV